MVPHGQTRGTEAEEVSALPGLHSGGGDGEPLPGCAPHSHPAAARPPRLAARQPGLHPSPGRTAVNWASSRPGGERGGMYKPINNIWRRASKRQQPRVSHWPALCPLSGCSAAQPTELRTRAVWLPILQHNLMKVTI